MKRAFGGVWAAILLSVLGCEEPPTGAAPSSTLGTAASSTAASSTAASAAPAASASAGPSFAPDEEAALKKAQAAAMMLGKKLKGELKSSLDKGDHGAAVEVCSDRAPEVGVSVHEETGVTVGRSSLRLRNEKNKAPKWVEAWLDEMGERKAAEAKPVREIAKGPDGPVARFIKPLGVEGVCVLCHGEASTMSKELAAAITERYPKDRATGYAVGDLRGALWAEVTVKK